MACSILLIRVRFFKSLEIKLLWIVAKRGPEDYIGTLVELLRALLGMGSPRSDSLTYNRLINQIARDWAEPTEA